jgi:hypothetical protein
MLQGATGPLTHPVIDRLEGAIRGSGGISSLAAGDNPGSLRTGRALSQMGEFSIDPRVEEANKQMDRALIAVNEGIAAVELGYYPDKKIFGYTGWGTDQSVIEYTPRDLFTETSLNVVQHDFPGSDAQSTSVVVGQMVGAGLMSKATARRKHPYIEDPEQEERLATIETIQAATLNALTQRAAMGQLPEIDVAAILKRVRSGEELEDAIEAVNKLAQARQATPAVTPDQMQPGLADPGMGVEQPPPTEAIPTPDQSQLNFRALTNALNTGRGQ